VTRVFPCVGGYKEFAPEKDSTQTRVSTGAQFFTPAYNIRSIINRSTRPDPHLPGAGEPGSWADKPIRIIMHRKPTTILSQLISLIILSILLFSCNSSNQPMNKREETTSNYTVDRQEKYHDFFTENKLNDIPDEWGLFNVPSSNRAYLINLSRIVNTQFGRDFVLKLHTDSIGIIDTQLENQKIENVNVKLHAVSETIILFLDNNKEYDLSNEIESEHNLIIKSSTTSVILK
jgi:hypothetical protein